MRTKYGSDQARLDADLAALRDPRRVEEMVVAARTALAAWEERLEVNAGPFAAGEMPGHEDAAVFGWYCSMQLNAANGQVWESEVNPKVRRWVGEMKRVTGLDPRFEQVEF